MVVRRRVEEGNVRQGKRKERKSKGEEREEGER